MLGALVIVFREVLEAGLIVGITLAATRGIAHRGWWIGTGVLGGALGACTVALFVQTLSAAFAGVGQELFNAGILSLAVVMLAWHNIWMAGHGRELAAEMRGVGQAVVAGTTSLLGLATVVGVAVLREGAEVALFLYGVAAASEAGSGPSLLLGGVLGLVLGGAVGLVTYLGLLRIPSRHLFGVTSLLLALLAAGMAAQAVAFLEQANLVTALGSTLWDSSEVLSDTSLVGRALHTLIGYTDHPTGLQALVYALVLTAILVLTRAMKPRVPMHRTAAAARG
jgi:high-affinity iron transporter